MENRLIVITGPTGVGKTKASVKLAEELGTEIISADSMQVYRGMDIGTAKVTEEEAMGVKHHLIDICEPDFNYDVTCFQKKAAEIIDVLHKRDKIPVVCGGTGFYIEALLYDTDFTEEEGDPLYKEELFKLACDKGNRAVHELLLKCDPLSYEKIPENNVKKTVRALEFFKLHGFPISQHNITQKEKHEKSIYDTKLFVLTCEREELCRRINERVDRMMEDGLLEEALRITKSGVKKDSTSMQAIGYRELVPYFEGEITLKEAVENIKAHSRQYAKRQITWWKRNKDAIWIDVLKGDVSDEIRRNLW